VDLSEFILRIDHSAMVTKSHYCSGDNDQTSTAYTIKSTPLLMCAHFLSPVAFMKSKLFTEC
jgi:hypothetical protein